jgi:pimeloyl-ACP methyl ester carboxylesterase
MGTTGFSWLSWGTLISLAFALLTDDFDLTLGAVLLACAALSAVTIEGTAWIAIDESELRWRATFVRRSVPLDKIESLSIARHRFMPGDIPVLTLALRTGREVRLTPSMGAGNAAREQFAALVSERLARR